MRHHNQAEEPENSLNGPLLRIYGVEGSYDMLDGDKLGLEDPAYFQEMEASCVLSHLDLTTAFQSQGERT